MCPRHTTCVYTNVYKLLCIVLYIWYMVYTLLSLYICIIYVGTNRYDISNDGNYAVHTYSNVNKPPCTNIVSLPDHTVITVLAENKQLQNMFNDINCPELVFFKVPVKRSITWNEIVTLDSVPLDANSDSVELDCWRLLPPNFDAAKQYPVIFHVYGEPAAQVVRDQWQGKVGLWHRMLCQQGAVVICVDNRLVYALCAY